MRFFEINEGIRMGARELSAINLNDLTIGFEFEVAVSGAAGMGSGGDDINMADVDLDAALDEFQFIWDNGGSTFDFNDWFKYEYTRENSFHDIVTDYGYEPQYGWAENREDFLKYLNNESQRVYTNVVIQYGEDAVEKAKKLESDIQNYYDGDIDKFLQSDFNNVKRIIFIAYRYFYTMPARMPDSEFDKRFAEIIEENTREKLEKEAKKEYKNWLKDFGNMPKEYDEDSEEYLDFDPDDMFYFYDKDGNIISISDDIEDLDDLLKYFDVDISEIKEDTREEW